MQPVERACCGLSTCRDTGYRRGMMAIRAENIMGDCASGDSGNTLVVRP